MAKDMRSIGSVDKEES